MRWTTRIRKRLAGEEGSALTEFAIVAPLFVILIYWAQFFADLGVLKLKAEEAARYAVWEMTAQRSPAAVSNEVRTRFADIASPEAYSGTSPEGALAWQTVNVGVVNIQDRIDAPFSGRVNQPPSDGSFLGDLMVSISKFLNKAADWIMKQLKFDTRGFAEAEVQMTVQNTLFPSGDVLGIFFDTGVNPTITVRARSPQLLWNTWKAWPGKAWGGSVDTDPYDTYPRVSSKASAPETVVSNQVDKMRFWGFGRYLSFADPVFEFLKMPAMFGSKTWKEKTAGDGPITMLPGEPQRQSWQPGYNQPVQRIGNEWQRTTARKLAPRGTVDYGVDRARFTTPSHVWSSEWTGRGGTNVRAGSQPMAPQNTNPYVKMYRCRSAYYMGAMREQLQHYNDPSWPSRAYPGCR